MLSPAEISTEHKYTVFEVNLKVSGPKEPAGFSNKPGEVFSANRYCN